MYLLYTGPSLIDRSPIVALLTENSANTDTGPMNQVYILCRDTKPTDALKSGADTAICGDCPAKNAWCYVNVGQAPNMVWAAYRRGNYTVPTGADWLKLRRRPTRFGAYGDPAAVPDDVWARFEKSTSYTHQWRNPNVAAQAYSMASVETRHQAEEAHWHGYRTFRVIAAGEKLMPKEIMCPKADGRLTCIDCMACHGNAKGRGANVAIPIHGPKLRHVSPKHQKYALYREGLLTINAPTPAQQLYREETAAALALHTRTDTAQLLRDHRAILAALDEEPSR